MTVNNTSEYTLTFAIDIIDRFDRTCQSYLSRKPNKRLCAKIKMISLSKAATCKS